MSGMIFIYKILLREKKYWSRFVWYSYVAACTTHFMNQSCKGALEKRSSNLIGCLCNRARTFFAYRRTCRGPRYTCVYVWHTSIRVTQACGTVWHTSLRVTQACGTVWLTSLRVTQACGAVWDTSLRVTQACGAVWLTSLRVTQACGAVWLTSLRVTQKFISGGTLVSDSVTHACDTVWHTSMNQCVTLCLTHYMYNVWHIYWYKYIAKSNIWIKI